MKRILEYGKYNLITCKDCGCKFSFENKDVEDKDGKKIVICPLCDAENTPVLKSTT